MPLVHEPVPAGARVLDVGSGAGLPGFPLKFARPDLEMVLLEPRRKKWLFLRRVIDELRLEGARAERARLEEVAARPDWRRSFDLVTTRGTGPAADLFPRIESLMRPGGRCWFYKGSSAQEEMDPLAQITSHPVRLLELGRNFSLLIVEMKVEAP